MRRKDEETIKALLVEAIENVFEKLQETPHIYNELPYLGSIEEPMAEAALTVLRAIADNQQYLREEMVIEDNVVTPEEEEDE